MTRDLIISGFLFASSMGSNHSKHMRERCQDYRPLSPYSETESGSVVSSVTSNPAVAKRLSQPEPPPTRPPSILPRSPLPDRPLSPRSHSPKPTADNHILDQEENLPDSVIARLRIDSCGGTVNSPLGHSIAKSPDSRRETVHTPEWPHRADRRAVPRDPSPNWPRDQPLREWFNSEPSFPADKWLPFPPRGTPAQGHPRVTGKARSHSSMAPADEQHRWTWNLPESDNTGHVSERDISAMLRRINQVVRSELLHGIGDGEEYQVEVKLTKVPKSNEKCKLARSCSHRDYPDGDRIYSVPLRKHLLAREIIAASCQRESPIYASCPVVPPKHRSRVQRNSHLQRESKDPDLARIILENHERNNVLLCPTKSHCWPAGAISVPKKERLSRQFDNDKVAQKHRFPQAKPLLPGRAMADAQFENSLATVHHHHYHHAVRTPAESTVI